jgi:leucyl-tRNA synthetase
MYVGGQEHAVLHLLYARFWHKVLYDLGIVDHKEPFLKVVHQGMILGTDGEKMSKSRGNVINPDDVVEEHGADSLRLYEMFMGPIEAVKPWQTEQVSGVVKLRNRCYQIAEGPISDDPPEGELLSMMHKTIKKVTGDIEKLSFNTAISALMVFSTSLAKIKGAGPPRECVENLLLLLSPFAPHVAEEGWSILGHSESLARHSWPEYDEELCVDATITLAVQVNGKLKGTINIAKDLEKADVLEIAVREYSSVLDGKTSESEFKKVIYVPGRILNIVL